MLQKKTCYGYATVLRLVDVRHVVSILRVRGIPYLPRPKFADDLVVMNAKPVGTRISAEEQPCRISDMRAILLRYIP